MNATELKKDKQLLKVIEGNPTKNSKIHIRKTKESSINHHLHLVYVAKKAR